KAKFRTYFVRVEHLSVGLVAIKYCDVKDVNSKNAYKKVFNDYDGAKVIASCVKIMHNLWKNDKNISFGFYAVPRDIEINSINVKRRESLNNEEYLERYIRTRFNVYEHAMINLFPPATFWHIRDYKNCIYILLNKNTKASTKRTKRIAEFLLKFHNLIFEPTVSSGTFKRRKGSDVRIG
ncbi:MAG TPA: hypothetical protein VF610_03085, partial [Segetibacter sp.]